MLAFLFWSSPAENGITRSELMIFPSFGIKEPFGPEVFRVTPEILVVVYTVVVD